MLYAFLVDTGTMLTFEMELAMESVETLMKHVTSMFMIPIDKQVLIMQGGEALDPRQRICDYSSVGTESNPIFLFSKSAIESSVPPSPSLNLGSETSLKEEVEQSLKLPPTYETLVSRAHLASRFHDMAAELSQNCISLVNEQYLQRQGWIAVIANLESTASTFQTRATLLEQNYSDFLELVPQYKTLLDGFPEVILLLSNIPVFFCLLQNEMNTVVSKEKDITLLDWINAQDRKANLEDMVQQCMDFLKQIQKLSLLDEIKTDRDEVLGDVSNKNMKEIGGLEERLSLLSRLCENSCKIAQEQSDMAQGFSQNQIRAQNIGDPSVLPDLCSSHQKQLPLLMNNHSQLRDIRRRCAKAKDELSGNLHARLRWVMMIEKKICDCDNKLVLYHDNMKRIKQHVEILEEIERSPRIYALTVKEVVRRRNFASQFIKWAKTITLDSQGIYKDEVHRRRKFSQFIGHHFLQSLFTGINDTPTPFAHTSPGLFDTDLPPISQEELKDLVVQVPELLTPYQTNEGNEGPTANENIPSYLTTRSLSCDDLPAIKQFVLENSVDELIQTTVACVEQTGTEQTEDKGNVNKGINDESIDNLVTPGTDSTIERSGTRKMHNAKSGDESVEIKAEDRQDFQESSRSKTSQFNLTIKENAMQNINEIRVNLAAFTSTAHLWKKDIEEFLSERMRLFEELQVSLRTKELETKSESESDGTQTLTRKVGSLTAENESLRKELKAKEKTFAEQVLRYRTELKEQKRYTTEMESAKEKFEAEQQIRFNSTINKVIREKDVALKKANEQLTETKHLQSKNEEKLQVLFNEKEELRLEKEKSDQKLEIALEEFSTQKLELEKCLLDARKSLEEKDKLLDEYSATDKDTVEEEGGKQETDALASGQIFSELVVERFHKRIKHLEEENVLLKDRLHSGPDGGVKILFVELQQCLDEKSKECDSLRAELELLQQRPRSSDVVFKDFQKGDVVQVYFNDENGLYMIRSTGDTLFFVHPDSLVNLDIPADLSKTSTFQAQVLDKEYCQAKKVNNRFKVAVGTRFYRVKVRSWTASS